MLLPVSPKSHDHEVTGPVELSVKTTVKGEAPVVGVPLPLISYGGTAMVTILIGCGLMLGVDIHRDVAMPRFPSERGR